MAKFINIPTLVTGQTNLLFNGDNIVTVIPPTVGDVTATGIYCTVVTNSKLFRLTFNGASAAIQNANAIAGSAQINKALLGTYSGPVQFDVTFTSGGISTITPA